jgi:chorismate mutase/prephenate dehydrogenase
MSSTTFDAQFDVAARVSNDSPELYFEIQHLNEYGSESLDALAQAVESVRSAVRDGDAARFKELMVAGQEYTHGRRSVTQRRA